MKKMPTLFKRNLETWLVYDEVAEGCEWVTKGEGTATRKFDGTACLIKNDTLYKRYDCKKGKVSPKVGFACQPFRDPETGHWPWWIPVVEDDKYYIGAFLRMPESVFEVGAEDKLNRTYELCGPKVNSNPEGFKHHILIPHGECKFFDCPRTFNEIKEYFKDKDIEGIVWHRDNGDMCKIKKKDFGMSREIKPGTIVKADKTGIYVKTGDNKLRGSK